MMWSTTVHGIDHASKLLERMNQSGHITITIRQLVFRSAASISMYIYTSDDISLIYISLIRYLLSDAS